MSASDEPREHQRQSDPDEHAQDERGDQGERKRLGPVVAQRRLRTQLRQLRNEQRERKTQKAVATALDWSQSKLLRLEAGHVPIATSDLIALLTLYGVTDQKRLNSWVELARISRQTTIRETYTDIFSKAFAEFIQYESYASIIRQYETKLIPGILQTEEYTEAVLRAYLAPNPNETTVGRTVQARRERAEELLDRTEDRPEMFFIVDEAAVRRQVGRESGDSALMVRQLQHLKDLSQRSNIQLQIVPFTYGIYTAMQGPFEMLEFEDPIDLPMLYVENPQGDELFHEDVDQVAPYFDIFTELEESLKKDSSIDFNRQLDNIIRAMVKGNPASP